MLVNIHTNNKTGSSALFLHICAHVCIYMYVTTIIKEKEATKSLTLKEDMGRVGGTKVRGKWYHSISIENTVFTKRTKRKKLKFV